MEAAKALGGSFKLVTLTPKTKGDDSTAHRNIKEWGQPNGGGMMTGPDHDFPELYFSSYSYLRSALDSCTAREFVTGTARFR